MARKDILFKDSEWTWIWQKKIKKTLGDVMIIINFVVYDRLSMYNLIIRVRKIINYLIRDYITKVQSHLIILRHYHIKRRNYFHVYSLFKQPYVKILTMLLLKYGVNPYNNSWCVRSLIWNGMAKGEKKSQYGMRIEKTKISWLSHAIKSK